MSKVSTYLMFARSTEEAFTFYKSVFKTDFLAPITRLKDRPAPPDAPALSKADGELVMHVALPILAKHILYGSDRPESMGNKLIVGNNFSIFLEPESRAETERIFKALSKGGKVESPLADMFWGAYWGTLTDRFGINWMLNCTAKK